MEERKKNPQRKLGRLTSRYNECNSVTKLNCNNITELKKPYTRMTLSLPEVYPEVFKLVPPLLLVSSLLHLSNSHTCVLSYFY